MAKRSLSEQQQRRIANKFQERLHAAPAFKDEQNLKLGQEQSGLVVSHFGQTVEVQSVDNQLIRCHVRKNLGAIVVGDQVIWQAQLESDEAFGIIVARKPRTSVLVRSSQYKPAQELAANIDQIMVVIALSPAPIPYYLDQHLVAAELQQIPVSIVLNKIDLIDSHPAPAWLNYYKSIGYSLILASNKSAQGLIALKQAMQGKNSILVGQSGVGKSSLINSLIKSSKAKVGEISDANKKGKHTTAASYLYHLQEGGSVIDSPGVREFGIWETEAHNIIKGFKEFKPLIGHCKFRDCKHKNTQGCAIEAAVKSGQIHSERLQSYFRIIDALE
ncbi:MAG: rsgA [Gammaproteobacteria bacterium]|nr:rsgA [Gammaproteobacteria bacterium]